MLPEPDTDQNKIDEYHYREEKAYDASAAHHSISSHHIKCVGLLLITTSRKYTVQNLRQNMRGVQWTHELARVHAVPLGGNRHCSGVGDAAYARNADDPPRDGMSFCDGGNSHVLDERF